MGHVARIMLCGLRRAADDLVLGLPHLLIVLWCYYTVWCGEQCAVCSMVCGLVCSVMHSIAQPHSFSEAAKKGSAMLCSQILPWMPVVACPEVLISASSIHVDVAISTSTWAPDRMCRASLEYQSPSGGCVF